MLILKAGTHTHTRTIVRVKCTDNASPTVRTPLICPLNRAIKRCAQTIRTQFDSVVANNEHTFNVFMKGCYCSSLSLAIHFAHLNSLHVTILVCYCYHDSSLYVLKLNLIENQSVCAFERTLVFSLNINLKCE